MLMLPAVPANTMAALDLMRPSSELRVETKGCVCPVGHMVMKPSGPLGTTATFTEYACAVAGTPQALDGMLKSRLELPAIAGPPNGPAGSRVSSTRHGVIGTKLSATPPAAGAAAVARPPRVALLRIPTGSVTAFPSLFRDRSRAGR